MLWFILWLVGTFFEESTNSITKKQTLKYNIYQVWIIISFFSLVFFLIYAIIKILFLDKEIYINSNSYLLLAIRVCFEILQSYFTIIAINKSDRSTFSIIRIITIPLLIISDLILWYHFSILSLVWLWILLIAFVIIWFSKNKINFNWWKYALFTAINAVITISLFKYSITIYWNSVEFDQFVVILSILIFYAFFLIKNKSKIPNIFKDKLFLIQWVSMWISTILISFSYLFLNASIATAIKRWWEMFWSILFWYRIFGEKNLKFKLIMAIIIFIWLVLAIL